LAPQHTIIIPLHHVNQDIDNYSTFEPCDPHFVPSAILNFQTDYKPSQGFKYNMHSMSNEAHKLLGGIQGGI